MAKLATSYLGLKIKNPLVVAASGLVSNVDGVMKAAEAGAGAVVLKSLFEEQLLAETEDVIAQMGEQTHPEAIAFLNEYAVSGGASSYLNLIRDCKRAVDIPIIASVNCVDGKRWADFAEQVESAGADALELNIGIMPNNVNESAKDIEEQIVGTVRHVFSRTKLPLAVKLGPYFTNPANIVNRVAAAGAKAVVLFNRFYRLDIDLKRMKTSAGPIRSSDTDYHESLRWVAKLYGAVPCALVGATGVHDGETLLKLIAAGAATVQICSALYHKGWPVIGAILESMEKRLDEMGLSVEELRGRCSRRAGTDFAGYERLQYVKALTGIS